MPTKRYEWTEIDKATANFIEQTMSKLNKTDRGLADEMDIDISYNRVRDLRLGLKAPARLSEFISFCHACGLNPARILNNLLTASYGSVDDSQSVLERSLARHAKQQDFEQVAYRAPREDEEYYD